MVKYTCAVYPYDTMDESITVLTLTDREYAKMINNGWFMKILTRQEIEPQQPLSFFQKLINLLK